MISFSFIDIHLKTFYYYMLYLKIKRHILFLIFVLFLFDHLWIFGCKSVVFKAEMQGTYASRACTQEYRPGTRRGRG